MLLSFQPVTLDTDAPDQEATLVFREGRLLAVLTRLSHIHTENEGKWFLETLFAAVPVLRAPLFETPDELSAWLRNEG